jgi:hypothetical protein
MGRRGVEESESFEIVPCQVTGGPLRGNVLANPPAVCAVLPSFWWLSRHFADVFPEIRAWKIYRGYFALFFSLGRNELWRMTCGAVFVASIFLCSLPPYRLGRIFLRHSLSRSSLVGWY